MYGPSRPEKDVHVLEQTRSLRCQKLIDPGRFDPDLFAASAVRVACVASLKSIYMAGEGVSTTKGPVKVEGNLFLLQEIGTKILPSGSL